MHIHSSPTLLLHEITRLWQQVLDSTDFTADTHFFLAGGDSLQLASVTLRLQQLCGVHLQLQNAAEFSTPRKMAQCCEHLLRQRKAGLSSGTLRSATARLPPATHLVVPDVDRHDTNYPASPMQQGLWLAEQKSGATALYNTAALLHLRGALDVVALEQALALLLHQHPVLRTTLHFDVQTRALAARLQRFQPVFLQAHTVTQQQLADEAKQRAARVMELDKRMYHFQLFRLHARHHALLLCFHHAVIDGWSAGVITQSLAQAYNKLRKDPAWQVQDIDSGFLRYCRHVHASRDAADAARLAWWQQHLQSETRRNTGNGKRAQQHCGLGQERSSEWPFAIRTWQCALPAAVLAQVRECCRQQRVTVFAGMLAALKYTLALYTGKPEQIVGFPVAERHCIGWENSVGCFVNTLMTRDVIAGAISPVTLLQQVHDNVQAAFKHAMPLQELIRQLQPALAPAGTAWFDVLFAFQNLPARPASFDNLTLQVDRVESGYGQYPLKVEVLPGSGDWQLRLEYASSWFSESDIARLAQTMQQTMQQTL